MPVAQQFLRFSFFGALVNLLGFFLYLTLNSIYVAPKSFMTLAYITTVGCSFYLNKKYTFKHKGNIQQTTARYFFIYTLGYILNWILLFAFVDMFKFDYLIVQAAAIILWSCLSFLFSKFLVFQTLKD